KKARPKSVFTRAFASNTATISESEIFPSPHDEGVGRVRERGNPINSLVLTAPLPVPLPARPSRGEGEQPCDGGRCAARVYAGGRAGFALAKDGTHFLISFHGFAVGSVRCGADSGSGGDSVRRWHTPVLRTDRQMGQQKQAETSRSSEKHPLRMRHAAGRRRERAPVGEVLPRRDAVHPL